MFSVGGSLIHSVDVPGLKRRQCGFTRPRRLSATTRTHATPRSYDSSSGASAGSRTARHRFLELSLLPAESQSCCVDWLGPAVPPSHSRWRAFMKLPRRGGSTTNATTSPACCCSPALISSLFSKVMNTISIVSGAACKRTHGIATCIASVTLPVESVGSHTGFSRVRRMRRRPRRSNGFVRRRSPSDRRGLD